MSHLNLFEPRSFESALSDRIESMARRFMAPLLSDMDSGRLPMRVDVTEMDGMYRIEAEIPGVNKDDINVRIDGNIIRIDAEQTKAKGKEGDGARVLRSERWDGPLSRTLSVAQDVDESNASARCENGVLTLELPKKTAAAAKNISIQ